MLRGEKCPDASWMFALKYRVRCLAVAKGLRENCQDVGPARKIHNVICHRSGQHYLKSGGPTYLGGPYGPVKDKMLWPQHRVSVVGAAGSCSVYYSWFAGPGDL